MSTGSWTLTEELFHRGDASFSEELRRVHAPEQLGAFAAKWFADARTFARRALFDYLDRPLNCFRHEPLVKRLFKLAEAANDDELMGAFLVAFDRLIRRRRTTTTQSTNGNFLNRAEAEAAVRTWESQGFRNSQIYNSVGRRFYAYASKSVEVTRQLNDKMPRPSAKQSKRVITLEDRFRSRLERHYRLFSLPTRRYLRRRAWRYFRRLGKSDPARYVVAAAAFLSRYRDADIDSDIHLLDNWGLMHALFRDCPALTRPAKGWGFLTGKGLADLDFAPSFVVAWIARPDLVLRLLLEAQGRTVRLFAVWLLRTKLDDWFAKLPVVFLLKLADHADPDVAELGFERLDASDELWSVPVEEWLRRLDGDDLEKLTRYSDLLTRRLDPARVTFEDALRLAAHRSRPVAVLGFTILKTKPLSRSAAPALLSLTRSDCATLRPDISTWLRGTLTAFGSVEPAWILEFLDSRHADVRMAGWAWFQVSMAKKQPELWHKLMESPYNDVRSRLTEALEAVLETTSTEDVLYLWASVLCSIHGGGRRKPGIVVRIVDRIARDPEQSSKLLPLLAVAVRSLRGPEFRTGLSGLVMLSETKPELAPMIRQRFPELTI